MVEAVMKRQMNGYMTVEAAMVMFMVIMVYVFLIDTMIMQYERCVEELDAASHVVMGVQEEKNMYEITEVNPVSILRLQRLLTEENKGEEK